MWGNDLFYISEAETIRKRLNQHLNQKGFGKQQLHSKAGYEFTENRDSARNKVLVSGINAKRKTEYRNPEPKTKGTISASMGHSRYPATTLQLGDYFRYFNRIQIISAHITPVDRCMPYALRSAKNKLYP